VSEEVTLQLITSKCFTILSPVHTVAEKCDCRRIRRLSPLSRRFRRQSHFSATVWTGLYSTDYGLEADQNCRLST